MRRDFVAQKWRIADRIDEIHLFVANLSENHDPSSRVVCRETDIAVGFRRDRSVTSFVP